MLLVSQSGSKIKLTQYQELISRITFQKLHCDGLLLIQKEHPYDFDVLAQQLHPLTVIFFYFLF